MFGSTMKTSSLFFFLGGVVVLIILLIIVLIYWKIWKPAGIKSFISESRRHAGNVFDEFADKRVRYDLVGNYWLVKFNFMRLCSIDGFL